MFRLNTIITNSDPPPSLQPEPIRALVSIIVQVEAIVRLVVHNLLEVGAQFVHPWRFATGGTGFVSRLIFEAIRVVIYCQLIPDLIE